MKKLLILALALVMVLTLAACGEPITASSAEEEQGSSVATSSVEYNSETKPAAENKLKTPSIFIDDDGNISWYDVDLYDYCSEYLLSINGEETRVTETDIPNDFTVGDVIKVKALASVLGTRSDSEWSAEYVYGEGTSYDFTQCGLSSDIEKALIYFEDECVPGSYLFGKNSKCSNGDLIIFEDEEEINETSFTVFTKADGYKKYEVNCGNERTDYILTDYRESKQTFYTELAVYAGTIKMLPSVDTSTVYASAGEYITSRGIKLLEYCEIAPDDASSYEISSYTEYSEKVDLRYLNQTFMHPETRKFEYLADYAGKISSWTVTKAVDRGDYMDIEVVVQFNVNFDHNDYQKLLDFLVEHSLTSYSDRGFLPAKEGQPNIAEGHMPIYMMPFKEEGGNWYDRYKLFGWLPEEGDPSPYRLSVNYLHEFRYDGGSNARYYVTQNGLLRETFDGVKQMIEKDGTRLTYDFSQE